MTFSFFASLLRGINARVEEVRVEMLKESTFYGVVRIRRGEVTSEVDARPSDALALAVLTGSPILAAEDVNERAGVDIPQAAKASPYRNGMRSILREIEEVQHQMRAQLSHPMSAAFDLTRAQEELIAAVFSGQENPEAVGQ